jgi:hypothetical protein
LSLCVLEKNLKKVNFFKKLKYAFATFVRGSSSLLIPKIYLFSKSGRFAGFRVFAEDFPVLFAEFENRYKIDTFYNETVFFRYAFLPKKS